MAILSAERPVSSYGQNRVKKRPYLEGGGSAAETDTGFVISDLELVENDTYLDFFENRPKSQKNEG